MLVLMLFIPFLLTGQHNGKIKYTESVKLDIEAPEGMEEMIAKLPKSRMSSHLLLFKDRKSLYKVLEKEDFNMESSSEDHGQEMEFIFKIHQPDHQVYSDFSSNQSIEMRELMMKPFLINDHIKEYNWKITSDKRQILDHICTKAVATDSDQQITAWYTTEIPFSSGPQSYNGLPGLILMVEINGGEREITAVDIELGPIDANLIQPPKKGKKVNREKFLKIEEEKMKEQKAIHGGSGMRMIIREDGIEAPH